MQWLFFEDMLCLLLLHYERVPSLRGGGEISSLLSKGLLVPHFTCTPVLE